MRTPRLRTAVRLARAHAAVASGRTPALEQHPSPDELFRFFDRGLRRLVDPNDPGLPSVGGRGRLFAWYWGFWGRALVFAFEATRERRFLDLFARSFAAILDQRDDRLGIKDEPTGHILPGWGTSIGGVHANEVTVAGLVSLPLCEFLLLLQRDMDAAAAYGQLAHSYLPQIQEVTGQYEGDYRTSDDGGYYVHPVTHVVEALNHTHVLGAAYAHLWALTGERRYEERVKDLTAYFLAAVTEEPNGSWSWPYAPTPDNMRRRPAERIWKAGTTIELPAAAFRHGIGFAPGHALPFSRTLTRNILRFDGINTYITSRRTELLDTSNSTPSNAGGGFALWFLMPDPLGTHRRALVAHMTAQPELFPGGWFGGARGLAMALTWLMRSDQSAPASRPPRATTPGGVGSVNTNVSSTAASSSSRDVRTR